MLFTLRQDEQRRFVLQLHRVRVFRDPAAAASEADCKEREGKKEDGRFLVSLFLQLPTIFHIAASEGYERETSGTVEAADFEVL